MHCVRRALALSVFASVAAGAEARGPATTQASRPVAATVKTTISYGEAKPILEALRDNLPAELKGKTSAEIETAWPAWVSRRNVEIRARLDRGDEDSIVNLLLFGTSFTKQPRALNDSRKLGGPERAGEILRGRIADMVTAIASPAANERLQFARHLVERQGIQPTTSAGKARVRLYLLSVMRRVVGEVDTYLRAIESAKAENNPAAEFAERSTLFRTRGLSSDTSIRPDFAIEQALADMTSPGPFNGKLGAGTVRRVAIVGPGLDFTDKAEGYDFYPQQTTQPFSIVNSLMRLGLAASAGLQVTTFDLSPRINQHLEAARQRARAGGVYVMTLPRDTDSHWTPDLLSFWRRFGDRIGDETKAVPTPPGETSIEVRAIGVRSAVVLSIVPQDVNIVLERIDPVEAEDRFDLIIATNILVYYDRFEQSLALANIAKMLRLGGILLSNNGLSDLPTTPLRMIGSRTVAYTDQPDDTDHIVWYQR